jgi:RHS repeat-associated protein
VTLLLESGVDRFAPYEAAQYGQDGLLAAEAATQGSTTTHVGYDLLGMGGLPQRTAFYGGASLTMSYFYGVGSDRPLDVLVGGVSYFYHRDGLDSTTALTDAAGDTVSSYRYDAYGNLQAGSSDAVGNSLQFDAMASDPTSGLVYDRARMYDPTTGRFLTPDPIGGGYAYAADNPVNNVDPSGMWASPAWTIAEENIAGDEKHDSGIGCTMAQEQNGGCGPLSVGGAGGSGGRFSWGRCGGPLAVYLLTVLAMVIGYNLEPGDAVLTTGAVALSDTFITWAPDIREIGTSRSDPLAFGVAVAQFLFDSSFWIWSNIFVPNLNFWTTLFLGANLAADVLPGVLEIKLGLAIATAAIGAYAIWTQSCWPGM